MGNIIIKKIKCVDEKEFVMIEESIMSSNTNGEFINLPSNFAYLQMGK